MRILIIGGTRFIGPRVVRRLAATHTVAVLHRGEHTSPLPKNVERIQSPLAAMPVTEFPPQALHFEPEVVLHMIAMGEHDSVAARKAFEKIARRIVMLSSGDVYRAYGCFRRIETGLERTPLRETSSLRTVTYPYRTADTPSEALDYYYDKMLAEREIAASERLPATILRLPKVYGPGDNADLATVYGFRDHPNWRWTHGHVENVAAAIALAVTHERATGRIYNVGEERTPTVADRLAYLPSRPQASFDHPANYDQDIAYDTSRIRAELGFTEAVSEREASIQVVSDHLTRAPVSHRASRDPEG
jgi:nucleoside-diphosphate-sugar epimerase